MAHRAAPKPNMESGTKSSIAPDLNSLPMHFGCTFQYCDILGLSKIGLGLFEAAGSGGNEPIGRIAQAHGSEAYVLIVSYMRLLKTFRLFMALKKIALNIEELDVYLIDQFGRWAWAMEINTLDQEDYLLLRKLHDKLRLGGNLVLIARR